MDKFQNKKIVAIGGGHGLGRLLSALRIFAENVTGIVAITDNGGSTGRLRQCQGGIAWGDTRNCINQLITEPSVESIMFEYRFKGQGELDGHNLGNLMLTALNNLSVRPLEAIRLISSLLKIKVNIIPMSEHPSDLKALTQHDTWIHGETNIDQIQQPIKELDLQPHIPATPEAIDAITTADCIILGPGSFLTSIMPPLLLSEIGTAISLNTSAKVIFIDNLGSETGPAGTMTLIEKLNWCENACQSRQIDHVISQSETTLPCKWHLHQAHLASDHRAWRHDRNKLRQAIMDLF